MKFDLDDVFDAVEVEGTTHRDVNISADFKSETLNQYDEEDGVSMESLVKDLEMVKYIQKEVLENGISFSSMEALLEINSDCLNDKVKLNTFTQSPSSVNLAYAIEGINKTMTFIEDKLKHFK